MPRRRKPRSLKLIEGGLRPSRDYPEPELGPATEAPPPDWLSGPVAIAEWERVAELLLSAWVLSDADLTVLGHYTNLHARCVRLWEAGEAPKAAELTQLRLLATEFGLTPASRSRAAALPPNGDDPAEAFFA